MESYKHQFAKNTLASWLRESAQSYDKYASLDPVTWRVNRGAPHFGVWTEYPICLDDKNKIVGIQAWDECDPDQIFQNTPPSYELCLAAKLLPICIFDVAVQHKGNIALAFEVVYKNDISKLKHDYLNRILEETHCGLEVYTLDADWILTQPRKPSRLVCHRVC